jgi:predicted nucleic acid-binding protein
MVEDDEAVARSLGALFQRSVGGRISIVTSELTLSELIVEPPRQAADDLLDTYRDLFNPGSGIEVGVVDRTILLAAAQIRADHRALKLPDAIHLATAERAACTHLLSGDRRLPPRPGFRRVDLDILELKMLAEEDN